MENIIIPLFPLNLVAFPGESLNLHIFEPRYKQLLQDSLLQNRIFGIPSFVHNKIEYGTEVSITEVVKQYDDGRMDVKTEGRRIFKVLNFRNPLSGKLYAGGEVEFLENLHDPDFYLASQLSAKVVELYTMLNITEKAAAIKNAPAFALGHHVGLSIDQEYELLQITTESSRQLYLLQHLEAAIPVLKEVERVKMRIQMNGHFKHLDPLDF